MQQLNLPAIEAKIVKEEGRHKIFDPIRKKYVVLTPEEWVRQHFIHFVTSGLLYPRSLIKVESGLQVNSLNKRSDIIIFDRKGKPWMLIECKAPDLKLNQQAFNQVSVYNMTVGAKYIAVTNGMVHFCMVSGKDGEKPVFLASFPQFQE
jgi:predicted type IV restriction endonuclease